MCLSLRVNHWSTLISLWQLDIVMYIVNQCVSDCMEMCLGICHKDILLHVTVCLSWHNVFDNVTDLVFDSLIVWFCVSESVHNTDYETVWLLHQVSDSVTECLCDIVTSWQKLRVNASSNVKQFFRCVTVWYCGCVTVWLPGYEY